MGRDRVTAHSGLQRPKRLFFHAKKQKCPVEVPVQEKKFIEQSTVTFQSFLNKKFRQIFITNGQLVFYYIRKQLSYLTSQCIIVSQQIIVLQSTVPVLSKKISFWVLKCKLFISPTFLAVNQTKIE
jgi:hypothetical protein